MLQIQCFPLYSLLLAVGNPVVDFLKEQGRLDLAGTPLASRQRPDRPEAGILAGL